MRKILSMLTVVFFSVSGVKQENSNTFSYKYEIVSASNSTKDIINIYNVKEKLINKYEALVFNIASSYHKETIIDNLDNFTLCDNCKTTYQNDKIVVYIGEGKGKKVEGDLRRNSCDTEPVRVQFFFSKYFD